MADASGPSTEKTVDNSAVFKWPGIEVLMEAYQRHVDENRLEQQVLKDQCHLLQNQNHELSRVAQTHSIKMAELLQTKQRLDEERAKHQGFLDNLKKCLKHLR